VRSFETERQTLKIKQNGSLKSEPLQIRRSVQGPVWHDAQGKAIALRVVGRSSGPAGRMVAMARAHLQQFEAALKRLQIPLFNVLYADQAGQVFNAQVPVRSRDLCQWSQIQPRLQDPVAEDSFTRPTAYSTRQWLVA